MGWLTDYSTSGFKYYRGKNLRKQGEKVSGKLQQVLSVEFVDDCKFVF